MKTPFTEPNASLPIVSDNGVMTQHFRRRFLRMVQFLNGGTSEKAYTAKTGAYTITVNDFCVGCAGTFTVALPPVADVAAGREYVIKNSGGGTITLDGDGSETIDGSATQSITAGNSLRVMCDGSNWIII